MKILKKASFRALAAVLICGLVISAASLIINASLSSVSAYSFNTATGMLNVDYANYLSKHDVVFNSPITNENHGLTVGNGKVGAMVWNKNGINMQVSGVDTSQHTAFSAGLVDLYPSSLADNNFTSFQQRLSLYDGLITTKYDSSRTVTIMGSPNSEIMGIHVEDSRTGLSNVSLDLSVWDLNSLTNSGDVPDLNTWKTVSAFADPTVVGLSRGQADPQNFGYTLAATVQGADFITSMVDSKKVRLTIAPTSSYTVWIACASRINAPGYNSVNQAKTILNNVKSAGYAATLDNYKNWWHDFWQKSFIQYSNGTGEADYLENIYYLSTYMIASGGYGNYPFHFINGVYRATADNTKWSYGYWYWNQRDVYNSFLSSNHPDIMSRFNNLYSRNFNALKSYTMTRYGIDGIWVPETMGWDGNARGTIYSDFTKDIYSTGMEAALNMYLQYKYTNDDAYLSGTAYPFMREVAKFYSSKLSYDSGTGKYYMQLSNAHETYWGVKNAITDLAAVRKLFPIAIETSGKLNVDSNLRAQWQNILNNLVPYPADGTKYLPHEPPLTQERNGENVACELIWPYDLTGIGAPDYQAALNTWNSRPKPYDNIWSNDAIQAARLGLGDSAYEGMKKMLLKYQSYPNGLTNNTNGVFEYLGVHLCVMNESLLQSYNDKIRVFPALPGDPSFVSKFTLLASGGFLVSSEKEENEIKYVGIKSLYGNTATVINPWGTAQVQVKKASDNSVVLTASGSEFSFNTLPNTVYIIERTSKPVSGYTYSQITGVRNDEAKVLYGTGVHLGYIPPEIGKYEAEDAVLAGGAQKSSDEGASGSMQVTHMSPGASVTFNNVIGGSKLDIRYCTYNNPSQLSLYINGVHAQDVGFPATNSWGGTYAVKTIDINIPEGANLMLRCDAGDSGANIDYVKVYPNSTDLIVSDISFGTGTINEKDLVPISVSIKNQGSFAVTAPVTVTLYIDGRPHQTVIYSGGIQQGTTVNIAAPNKWSAMIGTRTCKAVVNLNKTVPETNYANNTRAQKIKVK